MQIGLNLNNREALIAPDYGPVQLLELAELAEQRGFDSVWVGDSLLSKPRYEPLALIGALSQRTATVRLGTACLVTTMRHPVQLAHAFSTLDVISGGRTVLGACAGNTGEEGVKREFAVLGIDVGRRLEIFEEGLAIVRALMSFGEVTFGGQHFALDRVTFASGVEPEPLLPIQRPPPIWVVANPSIGGARGRRALQAARRVAEFGDGWMTCCRASHPEEVASFLAEVSSFRSRAGFDVAYQVTVTLGETRAAALAEQRRYIDAYYPEFRSAVRLDDWGPAGTADHVLEWMRQFREAGVNVFIFRFASLDQRCQVERFAEEVLPAARAAAG